jgi:GNAT superfamily N-acetyltransferase
MPRPSPSPSPSPSLTFRQTVRAADVDHVRHIVESTGFFHDYEVGTAVELVEECLAKGEVVSEYYFLFAELDGRPVGYTCYGPIACTAGSFDLYWIAVTEETRGTGVGRALLERTEAAIAAMGGLRVYIETSSRELYVPTRGFYLRCGYREEVILEDFYAPGDGKVIYVKAVKAPGAGAETGNRTMNHD